MARRGWLPRTIELTVALLILGSALAFGQGGQSTVIRHGSALPATCSFGDFFSKDGDGPYFCSAANTWTAVGGGTGSSGTVTSVGTSSPLTGGPITTTGTVGCQTASGSQAGCLSSTDWSTFNAKVAATRTISTTAPLSGGGDLSANRTLTISQSGVGTDGYLSSMDWNTFNNKQSALTFPLSVTLGGTGANLSATGGTSKFLTQATAGAAITVVRPACADLSDSSASCATDATNAANISSGTLPLGRLSGITTSQLSASAGITNAQLANSAITINGTSTSLGGTRSLVLNSSDFANEGTTTTVLHGNAAGNPAFGALVEADLTLADNTTGNLSTAAHGFTPKAPSDTTKFLRGDASWAVPSVTPCGSDTQVQFNDASACGGHAGFTYNKSTGVVGIQKNLEIGAAGVATGHLKLAGLTSGIATFTVQDAAGTPTYTFPQSDTIIPIISQLLTISGPTTARTYTVPDSSVTLAQAGVDVNTSGQVTVTHLAAALPVAQGGTANTTGVLGVGSAFVGAANPACTNGGGHNTFIGGGNSSTTETSVNRFVVPVAGTIKNLRVFLAANVPASESAVFTIMDSTVAQTVTCTVGAGAAVCNDTTHSFTTAAGDLIDVRVNCSGGTSALTAPVTTSYTVN